MVILVLKCPQLSPAEPLGQDTFTYWHVNVISCYRLFFWTIILAILDLRMSFTVIRSSLKPSFLSTIACNCEKLSSVINSNHNNGHSCAQMPSAVAGWTFGPEYLYILTRYRHSLLSAVLSTHNSCQSWHTNVIYCHTQLIQAEILVNNCLRLRESVICC